MYFVYIPCDKRRGTLYTGRTNNIVRRQLQHIDGISSQYAHSHGTFWLIRLEVFGDLSRSIEREKEIKKLSRKAKIYLIERDNPQWRIYEFPYLTRHTPPDDTAPRFCGG